MFSPAKYGKELNNQTDRGIFPPQSKKLDDTEDARRWPMDKTLYQSNAHCEFDNGNYCSKKINVSQEVEVNRHKGKTIRTPTCVRERKEEKDVIRENKDVDFGE
ncbi:hypothetical protein RUM44_003115 [Polyplax serrata]|uniref:Uncharacterized protein n=1 Tax=Polyplax serrata TaxID=468196 RepID=A0ABR1AXK3_POLSC